MYFSGKTYFNQEQNMRVVADQKNPPKRKKGVKKKKVKKGGKVDMKKLKSLFGQDVIVKLLLALVDKKSEGPKTKKERERRTKMKVKKTSGRGSGLPTPGQVKRERQEQERKRRIEEATIKKPGETEEDVLGRLIKEIAVGNDPASLEYLKRNTIPPELKKSLGVFSTLAEAYFSPGITVAQKKKLERSIIREVVSGVGGSVRSDFLTATEDQDIVDGIKESVEALKKQGFKDAEKIITNKSQIEKELKDKLDKADKPSEVDSLEKALDGLEAVEELGTTNTGNIDLVITDTQIDKISKKAGRKKISDETKRKNYIEFIEKLNPSLETESESRTIFLQKIDELIEQNKQKQAVERQLTTMNKKLLKGKPLEKPTTTETTAEAPKSTRADAGIFIKGAIPDSEETKYDIEVPGRGKVRFDLFKVNKRADYINKQLKKDEEGLESDITGSKVRKNFLKELETLKQEFRSQLTIINKGKDIKAPTEFSSFKDLPNNLDLEELEEFLNTRGFGLPEIVLYKGENIVGVGQGGFTIRTPEGFLRYIKYDQKEYRKELDRKAKADAKEEKEKRKAGIGRSTEKATDTTELETLIESLGGDKKNRFMNGLLTDSEIDSLAPRLKKAYPRYKKEAEKLRKEEKKGQLVLKTETESKKGKGKIKRKDEEKVYYSVKDGRKITDAEINADSTGMLRFEIIDFDGKYGPPGDFISEETAEQIQRKNKPKKFEDMTTEEQQAYYQESLLLVDEFGNPTAPAFGVGGGKETLKSQAEKKKSKQESQDELIKQYASGEFSVLPRILLSGRKKLARKNLYEFTDDEFSRMSDSEREKYIKIRDAFKSKELTEPEAELKGSKIEKQLDSIDELGTTNFPVGGTAGTDEDTDEEAGEEDFLLEEDY